jgi:3-oxoacyl-[acyl-carrier-protein] synthase II
MSVHPARRAPAPERRVVITGMGAVTCLGHDARTTWEGMREGRSGLTALAAEGAFEGADITQWPARVVGAVRGWNPAEIDSKEARRLDRCTQLGLVAACEAVAHSGWDSARGNPERHGIVVGSGIGGISTIEEGLDVLRTRGPSRMSPFTVPKLMVNAVTGNVSIRFNLQGPSSAHATACASSGHAIGDACMAIRRGLADVMLAGGAEAAVTQLCLGAFGVMKAMSTRNDEPTRASRPFDVDRDGFVLAEGAAMFVLESLEHAQARGATVHAEVLGHACSTDAHHITAPETTGRGASNAMRWALADAGLNTGDIDYVNAHGTSTPLGDKAEVAAVLGVFGDHARRSSGGKLLMSSTKSVHGHGLGASGAIETIACVHAVRDGVVAPTINLENPDPEFDLDLVPHEARERRVRAALNNTFGFGGHNVTLVLGRFTG